MLSGLGLPIPLSHLRHKYNIPEPTGDEEVTEPPPEPVAPMAPSDVSPGPDGTRPIGESPKEPSPSEKPRQVEAAHAKLEALSLIQDDEIFARELRKLASELVTGDLPGHEFHGNQYTNLPANPLDVSEDQFAALAEEFQGARKEANKLRSWPAYAMKFDEDEVKKRLSHFYNLRNYFEKVGNFQTQNYNKGMGLDSQQLTERTVDANWARRLHRKMKETP
jgi:hypothetical protein